MTYDNFKSIDISGNIIKLIREYNSMLGMPCILTNDTLSVGKLNKGNYSIIYLLNDIAERTLGNYNITDTINFSVSN